ncbi:MAG: hypothetical protein DDT29_01524 [Dehalococcoidia bacterium]|nr:hypothetical protein [Bacillota bacterium]
MKYAIIANLRVPTQAKLDKLGGDLRTEIVGRRTWGEFVFTKGKQEPNGFSASLEVRFDTETDMNEVFEWVKAIMSRQKIKGTISKHNCTHDENIQQPCVILGEFRQE